MISGDKTTKSLAPTKRGKAFAFCLLFSIVVLLQQEEELGIVEEH